MSEGAEPAPATRAWFGLKMLSVYEPVDEPVEEFIDDAFLPDWIGIESSVFLVRAGDREDAYAVLEQHLADAGPSVNVYGQCIEQRMLRIDSLPINDPFFEPRDEQLVLEIFYEIWSTTKNTDPFAFLEGGRPAPDARTRMLAPIGLYEHRARYEELRGPLPGY